VFRVLARMSILLAVAPPAPVAWWPGARTLPESVLRRLPRVVRPDQVTTLYPSRSRVIAIPVDGGRPVPPRNSTLASGPAITAAPWGEPLVPFSGVRVATCQVPRQWLRPEARTAEVIALSDVRPVLAPPAPQAARHATTVHLPGQPRQWPASAVNDQPRSHGRFRRAATLALGLLVSLVAMEAAARSTRR